MKEVIYETDPVNPSLASAATTRLSVALSKLYEETVRNADEKILWYKNARQSKGRWAKTIRISSIIMLSASTLIPFIASIFEHERLLLYMGYLVAGLGGTLLLMDRFYGFSTSWVRLVLTGTDLENMRETFTQTWQLLGITDQSLIEHRYSIFTELLTDFNDLFNKSIKAETESWAKEFQENFHELVKALKVQGEQFKSAVKDNRNRAETSSNYSFFAPPRVIKEAIDQKAEEWKLYFNVKTVLAGKKRRQHDHDSIDCIVFIQDEEIGEAVDFLDQLPQFIRFVSVDGYTYDIATDVRRNEPI